MTPDLIHKTVEGIPHTPPKKGLELYDFLVKHRSTRCLELGFAHGVGTVWMAGAMQETGGRVIAVDNLSALERKPSATEMLKKAGLESYAELHFDPISYTWHLQRHIAEYERNPFDFIFLDGAHTWDVDGFTFFLCERVLKPGGWILFDDLDWNYRSSPAAMANSWVQALTDEEKDLSQIRTVWEKLVLPHPSFSNFSEDGNWGWAQKSANGQSSDRQLTVHHQSTPVKGLAKRVLGKRMTTVKRLLGKG